MHYFANELVDNRIYSTDLLNLTCEHDRDEITVTEHGK